MQNVTPTGSALQQYMATYGQRLRSLLENPTDTSIVLPPAQTQQAQSFPDQGPGSAQPQRPLTASPAPAAPEQSAPPQPGPPLQQGPAQPQGKESEGGYGFREMWKDVPQKQQAEAVDQLDDELKKSGQSIDDAYDSLVKQIGAPVDEKLTRQEKGMLIMEFGLAMMSNSSGQAYGGDIGGSAGAAGQQTMASFLNLKERKRAQNLTRQQQIAGIETERARAKAQLGQQSALEARAEARDLRREKREGDQITSTVTQPDNTVVGVTRSGKVVPLESGGKAIQSRLTPRGAGAAGAPPRTTDRQRLYDWYLDAYGRDDKGEKLTGADLERVKRDALAYAADPGGENLGDAEIRLQAERSADAFMKSNWNLYRDLPPEQVEKKRQEIADQNFDRMKAEQQKGRRRPPPSALAPPAAATSPRQSPATSRQSPGPHSSVKPPAKTVFSSIADAQAAVNSGEIPEGTIVNVNGKRFRAVRQ